MQISLEASAPSSPPAASMGRTTAITMHSSVQVFTCDIDPRGLATHLTGSHVGCDVSDSSALNFLIFDEMPGGLDIMINNAGVGGPTKLVEDVPTGVGSLHEHLHRRAVLLRSPWPRSSRPSRAASSST